MKKSAYILSILLVIDIVFFRNIHSIK